MSSAIAYRNLSDSATLTASSEVSLAPVANLKNGHVARVWATAAGVTNANIVIDFGSSLNWDTVMVAGLNLTTAGLTRVRASNTDPTGVAGEIYDSGSSAGRVDAVYGILLILRPNSTAARYGRIDLDQAGLSRIEAGRLFMGLRTAIGINYSPGWSRTAVNGSPRSISVYGQTFIDRRPGYRTVETTFDWLSENERNGFVEEIANAVVNDGHLDLLLMLDTASSNLPRDSLWGFLESDQPVVEPAVVGTPRVFSTTYRIRERL